VKLAAAEFGCTSMVGTREHEALYIVGTEAGAEVVVLRHDRAIDAASRSVISR
jgi:hypothetical protein